MFPLNFAFRVSMNTGLPFPESFTENAILSICDSRKDELRMFGMDQSSFYCVASDFYLRRNEI